MAKKKAYKKSFFIEMNMQNPPKPKIVNWYVRVADSDSLPEFTVCGYEFTQDRRKDSIGVTEGPSPDLNFRRAFMPEEGHYWLSRDFAGQELRIIANLSNEDAWVNAFLTGGDIHKATAITIWGEENYSGTKRKAAKAINFGLLYGSTNRGIANSLGIEEKEAEEIVNEFFKKLPKVKRYLNTCEKIALKNREISNIYGRKRRMARYITTTGYLLAKGKRRSYNHPIQSFGAELIKIALIKIYDSLITLPEYSNGEVYFMNTIHDELNLSVRKDLIEEVTKKAGDLMAHTIKNMPVPIITDISIGNNMGMTFDFSQNEKTLKLTPKMDPIEEGE